MNGTLKRADSVEALFERAVEAEDFIEGLKEQVVGLQECLASTARTRDKAVEKLCEKIKENRRLKGQLERSTECISAFRRAAAEDKEEVFAEAADQIARRYRLEG